MVIYIYNNIVYYTYIIIYVYYINRMAHPRISVMFSLASFSQPSQAPELTTQYAHSQHQRGVGVAASVVHEETPKDGP